MTRFTTFVAFFFTLLLIAIAGSPSVAGGDEKTIVGRWDLVSNQGRQVDKEVAGTRYARFNKDGTWTANIPFFTTTDGKYKFLSNKVIEIDVPGLLYGRNKEEMKYKLDQDTLILYSPLLKDLVFKRVDSGK